MLSEVLYTDVFPASEAAVTCFNQESHKTLIIKAVANHAES